MYVSDTCSLMARDTSLMIEGLLDIERTAKQRNRTLGITGVLLVDQGHFVQVLEGEDSHLRQLMSAIQKDTRHSNVTTIIDEPIDARSFDDWNMDIFMLDAQPDLNSEDLYRFRDVYLSNEKPNGQEVARWVKRLIAHPEIRFSGNTSNS
jgi:hypothetical protein